MTADMVGARGGKVDDTSRKNIYKRGKKGGKEAEDGKRRKVNKGKERE